MISTRRNRTFSKRSLETSVTAAAKEVKDGLGAEALDAYTNVAARQGFGTPNLAESSEYELVRWTNNYWLMITLFRNHWISRRIVEKPAQDMCKAWPELQSSVLKPEMLDDFNRLNRRTYTPARIQEAIMWARLFGGAGALMVIDGHENMLDKPLRLDDINPGTYKGLIVFDRWSGITPTDEISTDINSPVDFNLPLFYDVRGEQGDSFRIHSSRILRFSGPKVPQPENQAQQHWGISEIEIAYEEIRKRDNSSWAILSLMFRAQILAQKNPMLAQLLSGIGASGEAAKKFQQTMQAQNELMSNNSMLLLGADGELQSHAYNFGGISDVYAQFQMDIAGAARMPVSILFGRTITGLGQSNDSEIRLYEQEIGQKQNEELRPQLDKLFPVMCMSEFGEVPDDLDISFPPVRVLTEEEKGKLASDKVTAIMAPFAAGVTSQQLTLRELKASSKETGMFTNIDDAMIDAADDEVQTPMEMEPGEDNDKGGEASDSLAYDEITVQGLPIVIETKAGDTRQGSNFSIVMPAHYGFIKDTIGADGDEMDCYVSNNIHSKRVFIVNQCFADSGNFDEHKCMIGYSNSNDALRDYMKGHSDSKNVFMSVTSMSMRAFKQWLKFGKHDIPLLTDEASAFGLLEWISGRVNSLKASRD